MMVRLETNADELEKFNKQFEPKTKIGVFKQPFEKCIAYNIAKAQMSKAFVCILCSCQ